MKLIALVGSFMLFLYLAGVVWMTSVNISRYVFSDEENAEPFWIRQFTIFLWPLGIISEEGRSALAYFWSKDQ